MVSFTDSGLKCAALSAAPRTQTAQETVEKRVSVSKGICTRVRHLLVAFADVTFMENRTCRKEIINK